MKIIVDCLGGDNSPSANVEGGLLSLKQYADLELVFIGNAEEISNVLKDKEYDSNRIGIIDAPEAVSGEDKPTDAIRLKKDSSMIKGIRMLREDENISGFVSTGPTGVLVAATLLRLGRVKGVRRPAFCPILPTMNGGIVGVCDSGANVDATPEMLVQYAVLGSRYLQSVYSVENPRVALLNVGTETEKGDDLRKETFKLLSGVESINFVGNMESRDLLSGKYDLIVCDGFSGNVLIKSTEGACLEMLKKLKKLSYEENMKRFRKEQGHFIDEMISYVKSSSDTEAAAKEIGKVFSDGVFDAFSVNGRIKGRKQADLNFFMIYYVFPAILLTDEDCSAVICDSLRDEWNARFDDTYINYTTYDRLYSTFRNKIFGIF